MHYLYLIDTYATSSVVIALAILSTQVIPSSRKLLIRNTFVT